MSLNRAFRRKDAYHNWLSMKKLRKASKGEALQFLLDAMKHESDACLFWPFGALPKKGYAQARIRIDGKVCSASRVLCERVHGAPPTPDHEAAHWCGNGHRRCVNPRHLRWATAKENAADRITHGTDGKGSRNPNVRLKEVSVIKIKKMIADGAPNKKIAKIFRAKEATIHSIRTGQSWAWLSTSEPAMTE